MMKYVCKLPKKRQPIPFEQQIRTDKQQDERLQVQDFMAMLARERKKILRMLAKKKAARAAKK